MTIVKINIHKVNAERSLKSKSGQIQINNNVSLKDVENMDFSIEGKKGLKFTFEFKCNYEPDLGHIEVQGQVLFVDEEKKIKEIKAGWDNGRKIPVDIMEQIANAALHKGNIQAIKISEEVNLPSPLPLPKIRPQVPEQVTAVKESTGKGKK
ncbi:hypothetical protein HYX11_05325 [Candidatus Woesearchaeota archaeon]|nr:hypothetical protein [Candidatus Woesearchaeota archaeon]